MENCQRGINLDHPDLPSLDKRLDLLFTNKFYANRRLTEISVNDMIGQKNISMTTTLTTSSMSIKLVGYYWEGFGLMPCI